MKISKSLIRLAEDEDEEVIVTNSKGKKIFGGTLLINDNDGIMVYSESGTIFSIYLGQIVKITDHTIQLNT